MQRRELNTDLIAREVRRLPESMQNIFYDDVYPVEMKEFVNTLKSRIDKLEQCYYDAQGYISLNVGEQKIFHPIGSEYSLYMKTIKKLFAEAGLSYYVIYDDSGGEHYSSGVNKYCIFREDGKFKYKHPTRNIYKF